MGIHYTYGANKGSKLMEKKAKKEKRLAEKRARKQAKIKLKVKKYNPETRKHEMFVEKKLPPHSK